MLGLRQRPARKAASFVACRSNLGFLYCLSIDFEPNMTQKLYQLSRQERLAYLKAQGWLSEADLSCLQKSTTPDLQALADGWIENTIGCFPIPMGIVSDCPLNGIDRTLVLAVEETSIIAALNRTNGWIRRDGTLSATLSDPSLIGQCHIPNPTNPEALKQRVAKHADAWIEALNQSVLKTMAQRGGGATAIELRLLDDHAVVHLHAQMGDAMGANMMNQACEWLKRQLNTENESLVTLAILSNLSDGHQVQATLQLERVEPTLGQAIVSATDCAFKDPYRACTHNKGILNGMEPIALVTGNDWRALSSGLHAYAARHGTYQSLSRWDYSDGCLVGTLKAPIVVGTVGGVTRLHPMAQMACRLMKVTDKASLAEVIAAAGLMQNLAALRALSQEGIVHGHMRLHLKNLMAQVGAPKHEALAAWLEARVRAKQPISAQIAKAFLDDHCPSQ